MKYLIILLIILIPLSVMAEMNGSLKTGIMFSEITEKNVEKNTQIYTKLNINYPIWKIVPAAYTTIYSNPNSAYSYSPYRSAYGLSLSYPVNKNMILTIEHECIHNVISNRYANRNTWMSEYTMLSFEIRW